jgi:hypothetical protein
MIVPIEQHPEFKKLADEVRQLSPDRKADLDANGVGLHPDPIEQDVIRQARELQSSGLSLRKIAAELQRRGKVSRNGAIFQATQVQRMVACETIDRLLLSCCSLPVAHLQFSGE